MTDTRIRSLECFLKVRLVNLDPAAVPSANPVLHYGVPRVQGRPTVWIERIPTLPLVLHLTGASIPSPCFGLIETRGPDVLQRLRRELTKIPRNPVYLLPFSVKPIERETNETDVMRIDTKIIKKQMTDRPRCEADPRNGTFQLIGPLQWIRRQKTEIRIRPSPSLHTRQASPAFFQILVTQKLDLFPLSAGKNPAVRRPCFVFETTENSSVKLRGQQGLIFTLFLCTCLGCTQGGFVQPARALL